MPASNFAANRLGTLTFDDTGETVVILGQYFHPEVAGTAQRLTELAVDLRRRGMHVRVLTGQPSYLSRMKLPRRELYDGVEIVRLPLPYLRRNTRLGRIAGAAIFAGLTLLRLVFSRSRGPLLIATSPPTLPFVGLVLKRLRRQPYICLVYDVYPQIAVRLGFLREGSLLVRIWEMLNNRVYQEADAVIALSRCMARTLQQQALTRNPHPHICVIHNWADPETLTPRPKERNWMSARYGTVGKLAVVYSGNMGWYHDFDTLLEAARIVRDHDGIRFLFIGDGAKRQDLVTAAERWRLTNVQFLPYQPPESLPYTLTCGDLAAVTLARGTEGLCMPGKLYTALAASQAILAIVGRDSELAAIVEEHRCGFRIDQGDAGGVVEALQYAIQHPASLEQMKQNARRCFEQFFTRQQATQQYYELLSRANGRRPGRASTTTVRDRLLPGR